jgi:hypothetical protein
VEKASKHGKCTCGLNHSRETIRKKVNRSASLHEFIGSAMASTSDKTGTLNISRELNISFEDLSYNAKAGIFKRRECLPTIVIYFIAPLFA